MAYSVLIVDDSLTVRMDLHEAFEADGFRSIACASGTEARAVFRGEHVDVAVFDVTLPDADGVALLDELRAQPANEHTVVVLLSNEADVATTHAGVDEYVGKPYDAEYVVARARQLLRERTVPATATVLIIDDSATFRESLRDLLENEGYRVVAAVTGEEGLRLAADARPNAIIVDGVLPGIDGATVIQRVRLDPALRDVPCLLLTAADDYATELEIIDAGADAFVRKQDDLAVVLAKLAAVLRQSADSLPATTLPGPTRVLVVDADAVRLTALVEAIRAEGHAVVAASDPNGVLALLAEQPVDCVVLDLDLLGTDITESFERLREVPGLRDTPLVMTGTRDDPNALLDCLTAGADDYLPKSDELDTLRAHVRAQIRRKQLQDETRRIREELLRGQIVAAEARAARELAETRAALVEELEWRNRELEAFSGSVSHDLRGPLHIIGAFTEALLEDDIDCLSEQAEHRIRRISAAAVRMTELIESLLLLSRASRLELNRVRVDLSALAEEVVSELRRHDPDRTIEVVVQPEMVAVCDPGLLRVVLENLIGNAWKFTGKTERPRIEIGTGQDGGEVSYFVRDNGAGFPRDQIERLFRPFGRLHVPEDFPGTGIGLTTVHRIVDRHAGRIWASGDVGRGAVFTFTLPAQSHHPSKS
jgi:two-component system, NtrC family, sensor kinase